MPRVELWIEGRPIPKPQSYTRQEHPQWAWRNNVAWSVKRHRTPDWPLRCPVALGMQFFVHPNGERRPPDFKNLWACCEDALKGVLYIDDYLVDRVLLPSGRTRIKNRDHSAGVAMVIEWGE